MENHHHIKELQKHNQDSQERIHFDKTYFGIRICSHMCDIHFTEILQNVNKDLYFGPSSYFTLLFDCCWSKISNSISMVGQSEKKHILNPKISSCEFRFAQNFGRNQNGMSEYNNIIQVEKKLTQNPPKNSLIKYGCRPTVFFFWKYVYVCMNTLFLAFFSLGIKKCAPMRPTAKEATKRKIKLINFHSRKKSIRFQFGQFLNELYASYKPKFIDISMNRWSDDRFNN